MRRSRVIEWVLNDQHKTRDPDTIHLLYTYIDRGDQHNEERLYRSILTTFWEQAVRKFEAGSTNTFGENSPPEVIERALRDLLITSDCEIYMIIDGLDQLSPKFLYQLIDWVVKVQSGPSGPHLRLAVSSLYRDDVKQLERHGLLSFIEIIEVTPASIESDIEIYLEHHLKSSLFERFPLLRQKVRDKLKKETDGMCVYIARCLFFSWPNPADMKGSDFSGLICRL